MVFFTTPAPSSMNSTLTPARNVAPGALLRSFIDLGPGTGRANVQQNPRRKEYLKPYTITYLANG